MRSGAFACCVWKWYVCDAVCSKWVIVVCMCVCNDIPLAFDIKQSLTEFGRCLQAGLTCTEAGLMAHHDELVSPEKARKIFAEILTGLKEEDMVCDDKTAT